QVSQFHQFIGQAAVAGVHGVQVRGVQQGHAPGHDLIGVHAGDVGDRVSLEQVGVLGVDHQDRFSGGGAQNTGGGDLLGDHGVDDRGFAGAGGSADHDDHRSGYLPQPREEMMAYLGGKPVAFGAGIVGTWHVQWKDGGVQIG